MRQQRRQWRPLVRSNDITPLRRHRSHRWPVVGRQGSIAACTSRDRSASTFFGAAIVRSEFGDAVEGGARAASHLKFSAIFRTPSGPRPRPPAHSPTTSRVYRCGKRAPPIYYCYQLLVTTGINIIIIIL